MNKADEIIKNLNLVLHPEGGFYREVYRSGDRINKECLPIHYSSGRNYYTSIFFLLKNNQFSAFHRLRSDEIWYFHLGSSLVIHIIEPDGVYKKFYLGTNSASEDSPQQIINAGNWFAAEITDKNSFSLVGCLVAPGFEFDDFELGNRKKLSDLYPEHQKIIEKFTRASNN